MSEVLFCPFCRESFEGETQCPEHELALVPFLQLPESKVRVDDHSRLSVFDPRFGRAWVALSAVLTLLAFVLPFAELQGDVEAHNSLFDLARGRNVRLWLVPTASFASLLILVRRRTAPLLRSARLAALVVALVPPVLAWTTFSGIEAAAEVMAERSVATVEAHPSIGAYLIVVAALPALWGGLRLGVLQPGARSESGR